MMMEEFMGPVKIKDGLFMGDRIAAQDLEFLMTNKVSHIINCTGGEMPNLWESIGIQYLSIPWLESDTETLFTNKQAIMQEAWQFMKQAQSLGESILVHSNKGQSRCSCLISAYLMIEYKWSLYKALEYLNSRRPDLEIRTAFFKQLGQYEESLGEELSKTWVKSDIDRGQEGLVSNTYMNALNGKITNVYQAKYQSLEGDKSIRQTVVRFSPRIEFQLDRSVYSNQHGQVKGIVKQPQVIQGQLSKQKLNKNTNNKTSIANKTNGIKNNHNKSQSVSSNANANAKSNMNNNTNKVKTYKHQKAKSMNTVNEQEQKINNITGNIIHVTVNNFMGPNQEQTKKMNSDQIYDSILQNYSNINPKSKIQEQQQQQQQQKQPKQQVKIQQNQKYKQSNIYQPKQTAAKQIQQVPQKQNYVARDRQKQNEQQKLLAEKQNQQFIQQQNQIKQQQIQQEKEQQQQEEELIQQQKLEQQQQQLEQQKQQKQQEEEQQEQEKKEQEKKEQQEKEEEQKGKEEQQIQIPANNLQRKSLTKKYQPTPPRQYLNNNRLRNSQPIIVSSDLNQSQTKNSKQVNANQLIKQELNHPAHSKVNKYHINYTNQNQESIKPFKVNYTWNQKDTNNTSFGNNTSNNKAVSKEKDILKDQKQKQAYLDNQSNLNKPSQQKVLKVSSSKSNSQLKTAKNLKEPQTSKQILLELQNNNKIMNNYYNNKYKKF